MAYVFQQWKIKKKQAFSVFSNLYIRLRWTAGALECIVKSLSLFMCFEAQNNVNSYVYRRFSIYTSRCGTWKVFVLDPLVCVKLFFSFSVFIANIHIAKYNLSAGNPVWTVDTLWSELISEWTSVHSFHEWQTVQCKSSSPPLMISSECWCQCFS